MLLFHSQVNMWMQTVHCAASCSWNSYCDIFILSVITTSSCYVQQHHVSTGWMEVQYSLFSSSLLREGPGSGRHTAPPRSALHGDEREQPNAPLWGEREPGDTYLCVRHYNLTSSTYTYW